MTFGNCDLQRPSRRAERRHLGNLHAIHVPRSLSSSYSMDIASTQDSSQDRGTWRARLAVACLP